MAAGPAVRAFPSLLEPSSQTRQFTQWSADFKFVREHRCIEGSIRAERTDLPKYWSSAGTSSCEPIRSGTDGPMTSPLA